MYLGYSISFVIPCLNEEFGLLDVIPKIPSYIDEVIVIDNNSTDKTASVAKKLGVKVIKEKKKGYGAALKSGLSRATKKLIITIDGDGTYTPQSSKALIKYLHKNRLDFVSGNRFNRKYNNSMHTMNLLGNIILTTVTKVLFFKNIADSQSGMMIMKKKILPKLSLTCDGMNFSEEIKLEVILNKHLRFGEYPISYNGNSRIGTKKLRMWQDGFSNLLFLFEKRFSTIKKIPKSLPLSAEEI